MDDLDLDTVVDSIESVEDNGLDLFDADDDVVIGKTVTDDDEEIIEEEDSPIDTISVEVVKSALQAEAKVNKAEIARTIFKELYPKVLKGELARKDVIAKFKLPIEQGGAGLTVAGAGTYYQKETAKLKKLAEANVVTVDSTDEEE